MVEKGPGASYSIECCKLSEVSRVFHGVVESLTRYNEPALKGKKGSPVKQARRMRRQLHKPRKNLVLYGIDQLKRMTGIEIHRTSGNC